MPAIQQQLIEIITEAFTAVVSELAPDSIDTASINPQVHSSQHADFQADGALGLAKRAKTNPRAIATAVVEKLNANSAAQSMIEKLDIAGPGFINITLTSAWIGQQLATQIQDPRHGVAAIDNRQTIIVDYSAPNVAKEMHVGHLRSTIIGDACVRIMQWQGHEVLRRNHIGDWGTPFGMLIEHLTDIGEDRATEELSLGDLNTFYRTAREKFEASEPFQQRARARVVQLQSGDSETLRLWNILIEQSQRYFVSVYELMDVHLDGSEFFGESAYNDMLHPTLQELKDKGLIVQSDGADCLYPEGFTNRDNKPLPLIVKKSDGGFGYAATDLAAIRNRTQDLHANRILYVVGAPQRQHLEMIYVAAHMADWLVPPATAEHISFGSVLGADGKMFKSRTGETTKLADLLDEAVSRAAKVIETKNPKLDATAREDLSRAVGIGAIKYADLSSERTRDYVFDYDQMLALEGNTAPYLQYAHARIQSILRQASSADLTAIKTITPSVEHENERELALVLLQFPNIIEEVTATLLFHRLASYLYNVASIFSRYYSHCPVLKAESDNLRQSRLALCAHTGTVLATGLSLLGISAPQKM